MLATLPLMVEFQTETSAHPSVAKPAPFGALLSTNSILLKIPPNPWINTPPPLTDALLPVIISRSRFTDTSSTKIPPPFSLSPLVMVIFSTATLIPEKFKSTIFTTLPAWLPSTIMLSGFPSPRRTILLPSITIFSR